MKKLLYLLAVAVIPFGATAQKWEGLADTPQMGWNSWNKFGQNISEKLIREQADAMVAEGLVEVTSISIWMTAGTVNEMPTALFSPIPRHSLQALRLWPITFTPKV